MPSHVDKLVEQLRAEGELVDNGVFTIARDEAVEKLAAYRLEDPHMWVLGVVQLGNLLQASSVDFVLGNQTFASIRDVEVPFETIERFFTGEATPQVDKQSGTDAAMQTAQILGRACATAFATEAQRVRLTVSGTEGRMILEFAGQGAPPVIARLPGPHRAEIHLRIDRVPKFFGAGEREMAILTAFAAFSEVQVTTGHGRIDLGRLEVLADLTTNSWRPVDVDGAFVGRVGYFRQEHIPAELWAGELWALELGVLTARIPLPGGARCTGFIEVPLETDLSGFRARENDRLKKIVDAYARQLVDLEEDARTHAPALRRPPEEVARETRADVLGKLIATAIMGLLVLVAHWLGFIPG